MGVAVTVDMDMTVAELVVFIRTFFVRTVHKESIAKGYMLRNLSCAGVATHNRATGYV